MAKQKRLKDMGFEDLLQHREDLRNERKHLRSKYTSGWYPIGGNNRVQALADNVRQISAVSVEITQRVENMRKKHEEKKPLMREPKVHSNVAMGLSLKSFSDIPGKFLNKLRRRGKSSMQEERAA